MPTRRKETKITTRSYDDVRAALAQARREVVNSGPRMQVTAPSYTTAPASTANPVSRPSAYTGESLTNGPSSSPLPTGSVTPSTLAPAALPQSRPNSLSRSSSMTTMSLPNLSSAAAAPAHAPPMPPQPFPLFGSPTRRVGGAAAPTSPTATPGPSSRWWSGGPPSAVFPPRGTPRSPQSVADGFPSSAFDGRMPSSPMNRGGSIVGVLPGVPSEASGADGSGGVRTYSALREHLAHTGTAGSYHSMPSFGSFSPNHYASPVQPPFHPPPAGALLSSGPDPAKFDHTNLVEGASTRNKPLLPETIRDAVHMYLESSGRHDVVVAMLRAEREANLTSGGGAPAPATVAARSTQLGAPPSPPRESSTTRTLTTAAATAAATGVAGPASLSHRTLSVPVSSPLPHNPSSATLGSHSPASNSPPPPSSSSAAAAAPPRVPPSQPQAAALPTASAATTEGKKKKALMRKAHDILKRGLLERSLADHARTPADVVRGSAAAGLLSSYVLPTLYGYEESVQPDLVLLYSAIEERLLLQHAQLGVPPPPQEVRRYLVAQIKQPMWSAADVADATFLPAAGNPASGNVLYGTVNQLVEELTRVYVLPLATVPERLVTAGQQFQDAFFRQHRLFLPSSALLAKLIERFFVPFSLKFHPDHFSVHGITIHAPGDGASVPLTRSQAETVYRGHEKKAGARPVSSAPGAPVGSTVRTATSTPVTAPPTGAGTFSPPFLSRHGTVSDLEAIAASAAASRSPGVAALPTGWGGDEASVAMSAFFPGDGSPARSPEMAAAAQAKKTEVPVKLVTHYSKSGSLWLMICEKVQTKVLTVILQWLTAHPSHFDEETVHCLLHFVERCCFAPSRFSDCPAKFPQIAEFIRTNCYAILRKLRKSAVTRQQAAVPVAGVTFAPEAPFSWTSTGGSTYDESRDGPGLGTSLCTFALDERKKAFEDAIPPPLRRSHPTMHTWRSLVDVREGDLRLPLFVMRRRGAADGSGLRRFLVAAPRSAERRPSHSLGGPLDGAASRGGEHADPGDNDGSFPVSPNGRSHTPTAPGSIHPASPNAAAAISLDGRSAKTGASEVERAKRALELFAKFSLKEYVKGLTAAHQTLFSLFPAPDLLVAALHATANFQTSQAFQQSYLGVFLRTSTELTQWATSLLLHAALLDGERRAALVRQTALAAAVAAAAAAGSVGGGPASTSPNASMANPLDMELRGGHTHTQDPNHLGASYSNNNSLLSSLPVDAAAGVQEALGVDEDGARGAAGLASLARELGDYPDLGEMLEDGGDLDGTDTDSDTATNGFSFTTNVGLEMSSDDAAALRRSLNRLPGNLRKLTGVAPARYFVNVLGRIVDLVVGFLQVNNLHASYSIFRGLGHPFVRKLLQHPSIVTHMDPHTSHQLRQLRRLFARPEHMAHKVRHTTSARDTGGGGGAGGPNGLAGAMRGDWRVDGAGENFSDAHQDMTLGEYMKTLSDNAEYPTIPAVLYYLRELQRLHAAEPTFLTKTLDEIYPRGDHNRHRKESTAADGTPITPVCVVHWRKLRIVDEIVQTVSALQTAALYYISSRATVVRFASVNEDLERTFMEQLDHTIVEDVQVQHEMANKLLATL